MEVRTEILPKEQTRFVIDFDQNSLRALAFVLFCALWLYAALLTLPFTYWMPAAGLDASHAFGSNYFPNAGFRYGSDLIFTFGPLGYIVYPENIGNHIALANVIRGGVWLLLLIHLILLYRRGMHGLWKSLLLTIAIISSRNLLIASFDYYALAVLLVLVLYLIEAPQAWLTFASVIFIVGLLAVTKFTAYVMAVTAVLLLLAVHSDWYARSVHRKQMYLVLATLAAFPMAFLLHNPSLRALFDYTYGSIQLSVGFNEAMSLPTGAAERFYAVLLGTMFIFGVAYATTKRALSWRAAFLLLLLYWLNFKHGFVRADGHTAIAFCFEIMIAAALVCLLRLIPRLVLQYLAAFPFFVIIALSGANIHWLNVWTEGFWSSANTRQTTAELLQWDSTVSRINNEKAKTDEFEQLPPSFRTRLEGSTAVVFPWELSYGRSNRFRLDPLYTMQAYSAYTEYLDRKTAEHLRSDGADYVLFDWQALDRRHPLLDVPLTWMALTDEYEPTEVAAGGLLLKRRGSPLRHKQRNVKALAVPIGKWIDVPDMKTELWARLRIPYSVYGSLKKTLYKADAMYLSIGSRNVTSRFRVVPGVLSSAFPLTAFPLDFDSYVSILQTKTVGEPITRIRLESESPGDYEDASLELFEETESQLTFQDSSERSFQSEFHLTSPAAIPRFCAGGIDIINEVQNPVAVPDEQHPMILRSDTGLMLEGWLADRTDGRAFDQIYAVINGRLFRATVIARKDVGAFFKNPALDLSGYRVGIGAEDFKKGTQTVDLIGVMNQDQDHILCRLAKAVYVEVQ
jgi:hypothetical protein